MAFTHLFLTLKYQILERKVAGCTMQWASGHFLTFLTTCGKDYRIDRQQFGISKCKYAKSFNFLQKCH